jgi:hypothetical protein
MRKIWFSFLSVCADITIMKECKTESGRCHSVCTLWFPLRSTSLSSVSTLFSLSIICFYSVLRLYPLFLLFSPSLSSVSTLFSPSLSSVGYSFLPPYHLFLLFSPSLSSVSTLFSLSILCFYSFLPLYHLFLLLLPLYPMFLLLSPSPLSVSPLFSFSIICFYSFLPLPLYVSPSVFSFSPLFTKKAVRRAEQLVGLDRSANTQQCKYSEQVGLASDLKNKFITPKDSIYVTVIAVLYCKKVKSEKTVNPSTF